MRDEDQDSADVLPPLYRLGDTDTRPQLAPSGPPAPAGARPTSGGLPEPVDEEEGDRQAASRRRRREGGQVALLPPRPSRQEQEQRRQVGDREVRPVVPDWWRDPYGRSREWLLYTYYVAMFHLLRLPLYAARLARNAPVGIWRVAVGLFRWVTDGEQRALRWERVAQNDEPGYTRLIRAHDRHLKNRSAVLAVCAVVWLVVVMWSCWIWPYRAWARLAIPALHVAYFGWMGRSSDRPVVSSAVVPDRHRRFTPDMIIQAFAAAGLGSLDPATKPGPVQIVAPGVERDGEGSRVVVDLPPGRTAEDAIARRVGIAGGLDIDEARLNVSRVRGTAGSARRVVLYIAAEDPAERPAEAPPFATASTWDFWRGIPFGCDQAGREIVLQLIESNALLGGIPGMGKTNAQRLFAAPAALDPFVQLIIFDGKGGRDWDPFKEVAYVYEKGTRDAVIEALPKVLEALVEEMERRFEALNELDDEECPDSKVTRQITRRRRYRMPLILVCIDEVHEYLLDPTHGNQICALLTRIAKRARAVGIMLCLATQNPSTENIPGDLRKQIATRFALKTADSDGSDAILGKGSNKAGLSSAKLRKTDVGVGILQGAELIDHPGSDDGPTVARTYVMNLPGLRALCRRGRENRERAGTLWGHAVGETVVAETPQRRLLDDCLDVLEPAEEQVHSNVICHRIAERWPDTYHGWDPEQLAIALGKWGVETTQTWAPSLEDPDRKTNRQGVRRSQLIDAVNDADPTPTGTASTQIPPHDTTPGVSDDGLEPLDPPPILDPPGSRSRPPSNPPDQASRTRPASRLEHLYPPQQGSRPEGLEPRTRPEADQ